MEITVLIIDDEQPARDLVRNFLTQHSDCLIIGECADGFSGVKTINEKKPDIVFLDVQMPKLTGFELIELLEHNPEIIFTTAYDQFAIQAFEKNAVDYLLKPFSRERFALAVNKAIERIKKSEKAEKKMIDIIQTVDNKPQSLERIAVRQGIKIHVIPASQIIFLEADGDYVMIHTREGKYLKEKTMKYFETSLNNQFIRIHRSYIVNMNEISKIENYDKENHLVILKNGAQLKASANGYKLLKSSLNL